MRASALTGNVLVEFDQARLEARQVLARLRSASRVRKQGFVRRKAAKPAGPPKGKQGAKPGGPGGPGNMTPEEQQKAAQQFLDSMKKATPEERKQKLQQIPEEFREGAKQRLKAQGIDIPD